MRNGGAKRRLFSRFFVHVDKLMVFCHIGEIINPALIDLEPARSANFLALKL